MPISEGSAYGEVLDMISVASESWSGRSPVTDEAGSQSRRALVVTADRAMLRRFRDSALSRGYTVEVVDSGVEALNAARRVAPDLMLLDLDLRDVHGLELVGWMRSTQELRSIPVIAATAFQGETANPRGEQAGVLTILHKPVAAAELDQWIGALVE